MPEQARPDRSAMHAQSTQGPSARGPIACEFCARPWFGLVAYCPYCGRKPSFTMINQESDDLLQRSHREEAAPPADVPGEGPPRGVPLAADDPPMERANPVGSRRGKKSPRLLFTAAIVGASALLVLWSGAKLLAPSASVGQVPSTPQHPSAELSSSPSRTATPVPSTGTLVPSPSPRSLCSAASEQAGLCKPQG